MKKYKAILLGDFGVGKTSFGLRLTEDRFEETTRATIGVAHFTATVDWNTVLELWDTAGQERYRSMDNMRLYVRHAEAAFILFDATARGTYENAQRLVKQIRDLAPAILVALVANKSDMRRVVGEAELSEYAKRERVPVYGYTSCKTGENIRALVRAVSARLTDDDNKPVVRGIIMPGGVTSYCFADASCTHHRCC